MAARCARDRSPRRGRRRAGAGLDHQAHVRVARSSESATSGTRLEIPGVAAGGRAGFPAAGQVPQAVGTRRAAQLRGALPRGGGQRGPSTSTHPHHGPRARPHAEDDGERPPPSGTSASTRASSTRVPQSRATRARASAPMAASCSGRPGSVRRPPRRGVAVPQLHEAHDRGGPGRGRKRPPRRRRGAPRSETAASRWPGREAGLEAVGPLLQRCRSRAPVAHESRTADSSRGGARRPSPRGSAGAPGDRNTRLMAPPGVVGLPDLHRGPPAAAPARGPRMSSRAAPPPPGGRAPAAGGGGRRGHHGFASAPSTPPGSPAARAGVDPEDRVPPPGRRRFRLDRRLQAAAPGEGQAMSRAARSRRAGQSGSPAQARGRRGAPGESTRSPSTRTPRGGAPGGAEDDLDPLLALRASTRPSTSSNRPVAYISSTARRTASRSSGWPGRPPRRGGGRSAAPPPPGPADERPGRGAASGSGRRGRGREDAGEHQRDWRIRRSKAHPFSTPVLAVPGSVRVSRSEKRSESVYSRARIRSSVPRRSCE